ncbi:MAG: CBS domain-containing protein [Candidatus Woesearchaeota archaeon]
MKVKECVLIKPLVCQRGATVVEVARILRDNKQRRAVVVDNGKPIGIVSTTDLSNKVVAGAMDAMLKVEDVMTSPIYLTCDIDDELNEIFKRMVNHESFFCPVTEHGKLVGILTYGELISKVKRVMNEG